MLKIVVEFNFDCFQIKHIFRSLFSTKQKAQSFFTDKKQDVMWKNGVRNSFCAESCAYNLFQYLSDCISFEKV